MKRNAGIITFSAVWWGLATHCKSAQCQLWYKKKPNISFPSIWKRAVLKKWTILKKAYIETLLGMIRHLIHDWRTYLYKTQQGCDLVCSCLPVARHCSILAVFLFFKEARNPIIAFRSFTYVLVWIFSLGTFNCVDVKEGKEVQTLSLVLFFRARSQLP